MNNKHVCILDLHCFTKILKYFQGTLIPHGGATSNGNVHHKSFGLPGLPVQPVQPSMPIVPYTTSLKSLRHRVQVHLEILHSVRRMVFGVSMSKSGDLPSTDMPYILLMASLKMARHFIGLIFFLVHNCATEI